MGWKDAFEVVTRIVLDNPSAYAKVAQGLEERNSIVEIVPNTFGGVNTHLWRTRPTSSGLFLVAASIYSHRERMSEIKRE